MIHELWEDLILNDSSCQDREFLNYRMTLSLCSYFLVNITSFTLKDFPTELPRYSCLSSLRIRVSLYRSVTKGFHLNMTLNFLISIYSIFISCLSLSSTLPKIVLPFWYSDDFLHLRNSVWILKCNSYRLSGTYNSLSHHSVLNVKLFFYVNKTTLLHSSFIVSSGHTIILNDVLFNGGSKRWILSSLCKRNYIEVQSTSRRLDPTRVALTKVRYTKSKKNPVARSTRTNESLSSLRFLVFF